MSKITKMGIEKKGGDIDEICNITPGYSKVTLAQKLWVLVLNPNIQNFKTNNFNLYMGMNINLSFIVISLKISGNYPSKLTREP